jgi:hypothetical protein
MRGDPPRRPCGALHPAWVIGAHPAATDHFFLATGFGLFARSTWAGVTGIKICALSAISNFFFIPYYPIWALLLIGLNIWVIWALTRPGAIKT